MGQADALTSRAFKKGTALQPVTCIPIFMPPLSSSLHKRKVNVIQAAAARSDLSQQAGSTNDTAKYYWMTEKV
jgi:hypothetical protein